MKIDPERFWQRPDEWPLNIGNHVFLGRATLQVARALASYSATPVQLLSESGKPFYDRAALNIASEAASGRLKTAVLNGRHLDALRPEEWATLDRKTTFQCFFRFPGTIYRPGIYSESVCPIFVEATSLAKFVDWLAIATRAEEANAAFARVKADRYTFETRPDMLPPPGYMSIEQALASIKVDGDTAGDARTILRRLLRSGRFSGVLQFWETGGIDGIPADFWSHGEGVTALQGNGEVAIPDSNSDGRDGAYSSWAYVRVGPASEEAVSTAMRSARTPTTPLAGQDDTTSGLKVTRPVFNLYQALLSHYGPKGGVDTDDTAPARAAAASAWANRQNPRPRLPADAAREVHRIDRLSDRFTKPLKSK